MHLQKRYQLIYYYNVKLFFALIKKRTQAAMMNILNLHILIKTFRLYQSVQVQYVYHCCLCLIFDQIMMSQEQKNFLFCLEGNF